MQRGSFASSSEVNSSAASPEDATTACSRPAAAPLMSQAPRPIARSPETRSRSGSALQPSEAGTVSRCTLNTRWGVPRTASSETAPAPWSTTSMRKPGNCARR